MKLKSGLESLSIWHLYIGVSLTIIIIMLIASGVVSRQETAAFEARLQNYHDLQTDKLLQLRQELNFQAEIVLTLVSNDPKFVDAIAQIAELPATNVTERVLLQSQIEAILAKHLPVVSPFAVTGLKFNSSEQALANHTNVTPSFQPKATANVVNSLSANQIVSGLTLQAGGLGLTSVQPVIHQGVYVGALEATLGLQQVGMLRQKRRQQGNEQLTNLFAQSAILVRNSRIDLLNLPTAGNWFRGVYWSTLHPNKMLHHWMQSERYFLDLRSHYELVQHDNRDYLVSTLPWRFWQQQESEPSYSISVQWQDVTDHVLAHRNNQQQAIITLSVTAIVLIILGILVVTVLMSLAKQAVRHKQVELLQSERKFAALYQLSPLPILLNRFDDGRYVEANPAMEQLVGYSLDELRQLSYKDLTPAQYAHTEQEQLRSLAESGRYGPYIKQYRHKNGELIDIELNGVLFTDPSGEQFIWTIIKDIRDVKRVEKLKDDFVSTVSHELRTPLTSIAGALGLVLGGAAGPVADKAEKLLSIAHKNSQRLNLLINDLLDFDKLMAGKMRFEPVVTDLRPFLEDAVEQHQPLARQQGKQLSLDNIPNARLWVDPDRIAQVLSNYLSNAIKFSPEHGSVQVGADIAENLVRIWVQDNGPGISEIDQEKLFKRFSQLEHVNDAKGGTGLGLAISREIAARSGGEVGVVSQPGQGARFWLQLPLYREKSADSNDGKILVIEDDKETALILSEFLRTKHFDVLWAKNIEEAKQAVAKGNIAAVTLDLKLDGQNGADFFLFLRNDPKTVNLPVLVVSAYIERGKLQLSALANAIDWLEKPIDPSLLMLKLNRLITSRGDDIKNRHILHVEDDEDIKTIVGLELGQHFDYTAVSSVKAALAVLKKASFDLVLLDLGLPDGDSTELLPDIRISQGDIPIVIFSARDVSAEQKHLVNALYNKTKISTDILARNLKALLKC